MQEEAASITPAHILVGVVYELHKGGTPLEVNFKIHAREELVRDSLGFIIKAKKPDASIKPKNEIPLNNAAKRVLAYCAEEANGLDQNDIGPEHLILGMLRENDPDPKTFRLLGIELGPFREWVRSSYTGQIGVSQFSISLVGTLLALLLSLGAIWVLWLIARSW